MTTSIELSRIKEYAQMKYSNYGIIYTEIQGNVFIRGELVATYEGIIQ